MRQVLLLFLLAMLYPCVHQAQVYEYDYDESGNRVMRRVIKMRSAVSQTGLSDSTDNTQETTQPEVYQEKLGTLEIKVYPNPTQGKMKISVNCGEEIRYSNLELMGLDGKKIFSRSGLGKEIDIDITGSPSGIYLMQVQINETTSRWKIVKR